MSLETKIKQSAALLTIAVGIGVLTKYTGIDNAITPNKNKKETTIEQTEEQKIIERYHELTKPIYKEKTVEKIKEKTKPLIKENKKKTTIEIILEEENIKKHSIDNNKYKSSNIQSYNNQSNTGKKVFIYHQNLTSNEMMKEAMEVTDYWMPHFYEINQEKIRYDKKKKKNITKTVWKNRVNDKKLHDIVRSANSKNIMPMVSAFEKKSVMSILNNPNDYAKKIHQEIKKVGANGVSIDLESIDVGQEESGKLVNFMKILRKKMPGYIITIAVSPRFEGSADNGFKHHGFYDYKELSKYADYVNVMFYDFHKKNVGPIAPAHLNDKVSEYALKNISPEKIVILYPLYGHVWEHKWKKKKEIIKSLGPLSSNNVDSFVQDRNVLYKYYEDGELIIKTNDRTVYAQDGTTYYNRTKRMDKFGLKNLGAWKQNHGTKDIYNQIKYWKQRK